MSRHLKPADIEEILGIIDGWADTKIRWDSLLNAVEARLKFRPTRQTLSAQSRIKEAYQHRKKNMEVKGPAPPASEKVLRERLNRLEAECDRLRRENSLLIEQFVRWQYNCESHGLKLEIMNKPLPHIDREKTDI